MRIVKNIHNRLDQSDYVYLKPQPSGDWLVYSVLPAIQLTRKIQATLAPAFLARIQNAGLINVKGISYRLIPLNSVQTSSAISSLNFVEVLAQLRKTFPDFDTQVPDQNLATVAQFLSDRNRKKERYFQLKIR